LIGLIFVLIFFQNRGCSWLPSNRVKNAFLDRIIVVSDAEMSHLKKSGIDVDDLIGVLNDGEVNFSESITEGDFKVYSVSKEVDGLGEKNFFFTLPAESFITEVHYSENSASEVENTTKGYGSIIHFPKDDNLVYIDSTESLKCAMGKLGLKNSNHVYQFLKKNGRVDFSNTDFNIKPKAKQCLVFKNEKGIEIGINAIWYKNKIDITSIFSDSLESCP